MLSFIKNLFKKKKKQEAKLSCLALHELQSGDVRYVDFEVNKNGLNAIRSLGLWHPDESKSYEYVVRHVPDHHYEYGVMYSDDMNHNSVQFDKDTHPHLSGHVVIQSKQLHNNYISFVALDTDKVITLHKNSRQQTISSGLTGLYQLFDIAPYQMFAYIAFERYSSTISLLLGSHILKQVVVPVGTSQLVRVVSDLLSCPTEMARKIVEKHGVLDTHYDYRIKHKIMETLEPLLRTVTEVVVDFPAQPYQPSYMSREVTGWVLGGSGAHIPGLAELISIVIPANHITDIAPKYKKMIMELPNGPTKSALPRYYTSLGLVISGV